MRKRRDMAASDQNTQADDITLDEETRRAKLVLHIAQLVRSGAEVVEEAPGRALVIVTRRESIVPNICIAAAGVALYLMAGGIFFLLAVGIALLGWHRKLASGAKRVYLLVRVNERGEISELEMESAAAAA